MTYPSSTDPQDYPRITPAVQVLIAINVAMLFLLTTAAIYVLFAMSVNVVGKSVAEQRVVFHRKGMVYRHIDTPALIIEVLSQHSRHIDRIKKPPRYRDFGVPEYWVVDPDARTVEVYRFASGRPDTPAAPEASVPASEAGVPTPGLNRETLRWQPDPRRPALELEVPELFSRA
jgi:hypothetical protein